MSIMSRVGIANLPLHGSRAPKWLFRRMVLLSKTIVEYIIYEYGVDEFLRRISDPFWFQSLSCVLGWDWHSSGASTVTCGALKEALSPGEYGLAITGGKGKASRKTLSQIEEIGGIFNFSTSKIEEFKYNSRMAAKVDNTAVQDCHNLYHHVFLFTEHGKWAVIQQGMNSETKYARRYHWLSENFNGFLQDPHNSIIGSKRQDEVLDMSSKLSNDCQKTCVDLVSDNPYHLRDDWAELIKPRFQTTIDDWANSNKKKLHVPCLDMPRCINWNKMKEIYDFQPSNYEELLSLRGVGQNTIRALALISDIIYGDKPSWVDPVKYSFAVGGKDGVPYPVDKKAMDESIVLLMSSIRQAKVGDKEKIRAIRRLKDLCLPQKN